MNQLLILTHPNPKSFNYAIAEAVKAASDQKGIETRVRNLYEMDFNAILKPADFEAFGAGQIPQDIKTEQEHIQWADRIVFVYPIWWAGLPAMLKGYIDRVFSYGFAYAYVDGAPTGLLTGKQVLLISTSGTPNDLYEQMGMHASMRQTSDQGIFQFSGMDTIGHTFFGGVPSISDDERKEYLKQAEALIQSL